MVKRRRRRGRYVVVLRRFPGGNGRGGNLGEWNDVRYLARPEEAHYISGFHVLKGTWTFDQELVNAHLFVCVAHARAAATDAPFVRHMMGPDPGFEALVCFKNGDRLVEVWPNPDAIEGLAVLGSAR